MDDKTALAEIFKCHELVVERAKTYEEEHESCKVAKASLDEAQEVLNQKILDLRNGQPALPFEGEAGKAADEARMEDPAWTEPVTPVEAARRRRKRE
jgi:hypothetical protein